MECKLLKRLTALANNIRDLLRLADVGDNMCCDELDKLIKSLDIIEVNIIRNEIADFVNTYFYDEVTYSDKLWYLVLFALEKLIVVAMRIERYIMAAQKKERTLDELPLTYAILAAAVVEKRNNWDSIVAACKEEHKRHATIGERFTNLFIN